MRFLCNSFFCANLSAQKQKKQDMASFTGKIYLDCPRGWRLSTQLRSPLKPLDTIVLWCWKGFWESLNRAIKMLRHASFSDSCTPDRCSFSSRVLQYGNPKFRTWFYFIFLFYYYFFSVKEDAIPNWKNYNDQTYSCLRDRRLSVSWEPNWGPPLNPSIQ